MANNVGGELVPSAWIPPTQGQLWDLLDYLHAVEGLAPQATDLRREYADLLRECGFPLLAALQEAKAEEIDAIKAYDPGPARAAALQIALIKIDPGYPAEIERLKKLL